MLAAVHQYVSVLGAAAIMRLAPGAKAAYHAAAVLACNHLVALMDAALAAGEMAGIPRDQAMVALKPLVSATIANVEALGAVGWTRRRAVRAIQCKIIVQHEYGRPASNTSQEAFVIKVVLFDLYLENEKGSTP